MAAKELVPEVKKPNGSEALVISAPTPMDLLQMAINRDLDIDKLAKLLELQKEWEKGEARKAFVEAMNALKRNPPVIAKNKHVKFGQTEYDHATLDHVCDVVTKSLSEHGISHRWRVEQDAGIRVTCILTHEKGHSEETTLVGAPDNSGSKNGIQQIGSTVTYLQRYTLLAATGLAASNGDNDGMGAAPFTDLNERLEWIASAKDLDELKRIFFAAVKEAKAVGDKNAENQLSAAKNKRYRELQ